MIGITIVITRNTFTVVLVIKSRQTIQDQLTEKCFKIVKKQRFKISGTSTPWGLFLLRIGS